VKSKIAGLARGTAGRVRTELEHLRQI